MERERSLYDIQVKVRKEKEWFFKISKKIHKKWN